VRLLLSWNGHVHVGLQVKVSFFSIDILKSELGFNTNKILFQTLGNLLLEFSLLQKNSGEGVTMKEIESSLGGNICRCTGYRPIMDAFKTFAKDAPQELKSRCVDLEVKKQISFFSKINLTIKVF
jgi:xanthine dehydrogenase iron-sulfur cluster and FAD-binding subunit A